MGHVASATATALNDMTLPTFFIIGAAKAGTTSLNYYLELHPEIHMSSNKEPNFFAGPENGIPYSPMKRVSTLEEYEKLFDSVAPVRGEASPSYSNYPRRRGVPKRIKELVPGARFIYLVRDPIARTVSHYQHSQATGSERRSLHDALADLSDPVLPYTCHSLYATQLELYLRDFSEDRMLVVDQAELLADRRSTLQTIFSFLSVDERFDTPQFDEELYRSNERRAYPAGYARFVESVLAPPLEWIPARVRQSLRGSVERILWPPVEKARLDEETRARLLNLYAGDVERLRRLTGKDFSTWSL